MKTKRLLSLLLCVCMVLTLLPAVTTTANAADTSVGTYDALASALNSASDGDVITLTANIDAAANVTLALYSKTVTIDGGGFTLTGPASTARSYGLTIWGSGTVILKNITLRGGDNSVAESCGLYIPPGSSVNVLSSGTVNAEGGEPANTGSSYGVYNSGGTVNVTAATAGNASDSFGVYNGGGTVNVTAATGGTATTQSIGVYNGSGTVNVTAAEGQTVIGGTSSSQSVGVWCTGGAVNVTTAIGGDAGLGTSCGVSVYVGTVNVETTASGTAATSSGSYTLSGGATLHTGANVATLTLHKRSGAECVLDSITVAASADTTVGTLPAVFYNGAYSADWYLDTAPVTQAGSTVAAGTTDLYSYYYEYDAEIGGDYYIAIQDALNGTATGDTVTLLRDIDATANVTLDSTGKTVTIDGGGTYTLMGPASAVNSYGLAISGSGTVILKDITLRGGDSSSTESCGLYIPTGSSVIVLSSGTVNAEGGAAASGHSYGVYDYGGTVNVTTATGGTASISYGVYNDGGTVNAAASEGGTTTGGESYGVYNLGSGTVNAATATGGTASNSYGVYNDGGGVVNVTTAQGGDAGNSWGVNNGIGTVNVTTAKGGNASNISCGVDSIGTVNAKSCTGGTQNTVGSVNNTSVATLTLHRRSGAACVLDSITVAATGDTTVGTLPSVLYNGTYCDKWYTDSVLKNLFSGTSVSSAQTELYSAVNVFTVSGKVTNSGGSGLAAALQLKDSSGASVGSAVTAASDGTYTISGVKAGTGYTVSVTMSGYAAGTVASFDITDTDTVKNLALTASSSSGGGDSTTYYTITATAGTGGSISPSGSASIEYGDDKTYAIAADEGYEIEDVLVDGVSVGAVSTYTFENVKKAHTITASFKKAEIQNPFTDVNTDDWFYDYAMYVYGNGLMTGTRTDVFSPNGTMTRAMLVTVLYRMTGNTGSYTNTFSDVPAGEWYENAAAWAAANGIASGVGGNQFAPERAVSREQLAVMLYNYAKYKGYDVSIGEDTNILSYNDALTISDYAYSALRWACGAGIMNGDNSSNLNPQSSATRAEVAAMFQRFIENVMK